MRKDKEFEAQVLADLAILKTQMRELTGNGQPGRIRLMEERLELHEAVLQRGKAVLLGLVPALTALQVVLHFVGRH